MNERLRLETEEGEVQTGRGRQTWGKNMLHHEGN